MKICILGNNISSHIQKWIYAISQHNEIELHVITFKQGVFFENVHYHYIPLYTNTKLDYILNLFKVKKIVKKIHPDILHAHYATSFGFMGAFTNYHPYIITGWGADIFDSPKNPIMNKILKYSFKKADKITVLSKITQIEIQKLTSKEVLLIPFGVDVEKFSPLKINKANNEIVIGTIRSLEVKYGVKYLIEAFSILSEKYPNLKLEIVGNGSQRDELEEYCKTFNINEKVHFHGYVNQNNEFDKYIRILRNYDIFAILSILDSETFGVAAVEASSCAIPVIASNVGGLPEVVENNITGIIVPPMNAIETAKAIEKLIQDENLMIKMGENGRKKVLNEYVWKNNVNNMINIYIELSKTHSTKS